ncbi:MAG: hypothetical protein A2148_05845 [Chloroflexi bacterium RBG_16_68_14]|nr:MAG: hypothetical protein A2148_05845 [Chloroflexi bacterium RBG_16_68_14]
MPRTASLPVLPLVVVLAAFLAACASASQDSVPIATTLEAATERGPFGAGVMTLELVDTSRPTEPNRDFPGADQRTLVVELWYPADSTATQPEERDAALDRSKAPYPLIVFAHGLGGNRRQSVSYTQHLASHGYIVAAPDFPLSHLGAPGGPRLKAVLEQPKDVSFLIASLLGFSEEDGHPLEDAIDGEAIGVTGHSLGALTSLLTVYGASRDPRVQAALPIAVPGCLLSEEIADDLSVPLLVLGGTRDLLTPPASNRGAYDIANPPRYLVELLGANHIRFADVDLEDGQILALELVPGLRERDIISDAREVAQALGGDASACPTFGTGADDDQPLSPERQRELLRAFATPFFDGYLRGSEEAAAFLQEELPGLIPEARVEFEME